MKKLFVFICLIFVFSTIGFAFADNTEKVSPVTENQVSETSVIEAKSYTEPSKPDWADTPDTSRDRDFSNAVKQRIVITFIALIIVSVLIYLTVRFLSSNKLNLPFLGLGQQSAMIKVIDRHMLAPNKALYLVKVAEKHVLLGASESGVNFLCRISDEDIKSCEIKTKSEILEKSKPVKPPFEFFGEEGKNGG